VNIVMSGRVHCTVVVVGVVTIWVLEEPHGNISVERTCTHEKLLLFLANDKRFNSIGVA